VSNVGGPRKERKTTKSRGEKGGPRGEKSSVTELYLKCNLEKGRREAIQQASHLVGGQFGSRRFLRALILVFLYRKGGGGHLEGRRRRD